MDKHADPTGVIGRQGADLPFGEKKIKIRILTNGEIKAQRASLDELVWYGDGSVGQQYYDGSAVNKGDFGKLIEWLSFWVDGGMTQELFDTAYPEQVVRLIDAIFEQGGLSWLRRLVGNSNARPSAMVTAPVPVDDETTTPANGSTSSTNSSSQSEDLQATPESTSPATG